MLMQTLLSSPRLDQLAQMRLEPLVGPLLTHPHQARVARHISREDCGEAADRGHLSRNGRLA